MMAYAALLGAVVIWGLSFPVMMHSSSVSGSARWWWQRA